jgi:hypothetical protein
VVSTTHDPATPYQAGVDLARQLGAPLITYEGTQHTAVFNGIECIDTAVVITSSTAWCRAPALLSPNGRGAQCISLAHHMGARSADERGASSPNATRM